MIIKFKFRDTRIMPEQVMNTYVNYIESQVRDRHLRKNDFEKWDSDFDDIKQEELFIDEKLGIDYKNKNDTEVINIPDFSLTQKTIPTDTENLTNLTGVFTGIDDDTAELKEKIKDYQGTVWIPIISLKEDDAVEKRLDRESLWMKKTREIVPMIAEEIGIPNSNLNWLAAFHEKPVEKQKKAGKQPHVHLILWEKQPILSNRMISKNNLENIKERVENNFLIEAKHEQINDYLKNNKHIINKDEEEKQNILKIQKELFGDDEFSKKDDILNKESNEKEMLRTDSHLSEYLYADDTHGTTSLYNDKKEGLAIETRTNEEVMKGNNHYSSKNRGSWKEKKNASTDLAVVNDGGVAGELKLRQDKEEIAREHIAYLDDKNSDLSQKDFELLQISEGKMFKLVNSLYSFESVKTKKEFDELTQHLIKIQQKTERGDKISEMESEVLEYAGLSLSTDANSISERIKECVSINQDIRELAESLAENLYYKTITFGNMQVDLARNFEVALTENLYRNIQQMKPAENNESVFKKMKITDVISNGIPEKMATREEIISNLELLSVKALNENEKNTDIFKGIKRMVETNNFPLEFNDIRAILESAEERTKKGESISDTDLRLQTSIKNLGYQNTQLEELTIERGRFYKTLAVSIADSCKSVGFIKEKPDSYDKIDDYNSYIRFCDELGTFTEGVGREFSNSKELM